MEENIADALKIAGSILLFVIGLSVAFLAFSQARESVDAIVKYSDREYFTIDNDSRFYYWVDKSNELGTNRYVGIETVIPTIYRAYKENFKIIFESNDSDFNLYQEVDPETGLYKNIKKIDLKEQAIGSDEDCRIFLNGILYRDFKGVGDYNNDGNPEDNKDDYERKFKIKIDDSQGFYSYLNTKLNDKRIKEELGIYYDNDVGGTPDPQSVQDVNKVEKRVITYTFE